MRALQPAWKAKTALKWVGSALHRSLVGFIQCYLVRIGSGAESSYFRLEDFGCDFKRPDWLCKVKAERSVINGHGKAISK